MAPDRIELMTPDVKPPVFLVLPVTYKCNARCVMCSIWERQREYTDIPLGKLEQIFSEPLLANNLTHINLSGGETLLRRDCPDIVGMFARLCVRMEVLTIASNGFVPSMIERFCEVALPKVPERVRFHVSLSLDGDRPTHNLVRGRRYAYDGVIESARRLKILATTHRNVSVGFHATLSSYNHAQGRELYEFARQEGFGIGFTPALFNTTYICSSKSPAEFQLKETHRRSLGEFFSWLSERDDREYYRMVTGMLETGGSRSMSCLAREQGVLLDSDGRVYPCGQSADMALGSVYERTFTDLWLGHRARRVRIDIQHECDKCMTDCYPAALT